MKNLFLDLGTNHGQGLLEFNRKYHFINNEKWDIICFEPNPALNFDFSKINNLHMINKAVWVKDDTLTFARNFLPQHAARDYNSQVPEGFGAQANIGAATSCGSRLVEGGILPIAGIHTNHSHPLPDRTQVEAIDFSQWMYENTKEYNRIVMKMDIEGAEFAVLRKMISTKAIELIDYLYVETHERFVDGETTHTAQALLESIRNCNVLVEKWD